MSGRLPLLLVAAALALAGCGERAEPVSGELSPYPATVAGAAPDPVTVERAPARIAALSAGAAELVSALGRSDRLVGVPSGFEAAPEAARVVRSSGLVDTARVAAVRPDLVVAPTEANRNELGAALGPQGTALYVQPDRSLREVARAALELGLVLDAPAEGRRVAARIGQAAARVERDVRGREVVPVFVDLGFFVTPPPDSIVADLVRRGGGELLGLEIAGAPTDACEVLALEPAVYLRVVETLPERSPPPAFERCGTGPAPRVANLPASLVTVAGPRAGTALEAVAEALHGDAS